MSTLTKIFVILLVLFSIAFTSMTVSMVAQTTNWRDTAEKYKQHARTTDTNLRHQIAASAAMMAGAKDKMRDDLDRIHGLEMELGSSRGRIMGLESASAGTSAEKNTLAAMNSALVDQLQVAEGARAEYRKQRDGLEHRNVDLEQRNIDMNDRVNELTAQISVLIEQKRQYEQQIHILRTENDKLALRLRMSSSSVALEAPEGAAIPGVLALTPVARSVIRGRVLEVAGDLVMVSVGRADGVKKNMVFVIHRGVQWVGDLKISNVDPNQSAGRLVRSDVAPTPGDSVTDALRLGSSRR